MRKHESRFSVARLKLVILYRPLRHTFHPLTTYLHIHSDISCVAGHYKKNVRILTKKVAMKKVTIFHYKHKITPIFGYMEKKYYVKIILGTFYG